MKKTTSLELIKFNEMIGNEDVEISKQAFSKAREKIKPVAFKELIHTATAEPFLYSEEVPRLNGYRIFAIDGTTLEVEPTEENVEYFGLWSQTNACRARGSIMCEVFSEVVIDAKISSLKVGERESAKEHIEYLSQHAQGKELIIFDRGYPGKELISILFDKKIKFLMRLQKSFNAEIDNSKQRDFYVEMKYLKKIYPLRVIKFMLDSGEEEMLITNLEPLEFATEDFKDLYFLRWSIETKYNLLKNCLLIEHFTGKTKVSIEQDFYAAIYLANMAAFAKMESDSIIMKQDSSKSLKYKRKTNQQVLIGILKDKLILMLLCNNKKKREKMFQSIMRQVVRYKTDIRPGRHFKRPVDAHHRRKHSLKGGI